MIGIIGIVTVVFITIAAVICYRRRRSHHHNSMLAPSSGLCPCLHRGHGNTRDSSDTTIIDASDIVPAAAVGHTNDDRVEFLPHIGNSEL